MLDQNLIIRPAKIDEVKILQALNDEIFIDNHAYDPDLRMDWAQADDGGKKYFTELVNNPEAICLLAQINERIVGYVAAAPKVFSYRLSKCIEIENIGVSSDFQSLGIGAQLMDECMKVAKSRGFQRAYVTSYFHNIGAINFYKKNGFGEIDLSLEKVL